MAGVELKQEMSLRTEPPELLIAVKVFTRRREAAFNAEDCVADGGFAGVSGGTERKSSLNNRSLSPKALKENCTMVHNSM